MSGCMCYAPQVLRQHLTQPVAITLRMLHAPLYAGVHAASSAGTPRCPSYASILCTACCCMACASPLTAPYCLTPPLPAGGGLPIKPYTGTTVYHINDAGLIDRHEETWDISALDAFVSTFVPSFGAPPAPPIS